MPLFLPPLCVQPIPLGEDRIDPFCRVRYDDFFLVKLNDFYLSPDSFFSQSSLLPGQTHGFRDCSLRFPPQIRFPDSLPFVAFDHAVSSTSSFKKKE